MRYLFGVSVAVINCTQYTTLKDLVSKLIVHSDINYKEWTKQLKHKMVQNIATKMDKHDISDDPKRDTFDDHKDSDNDEVHSQIWILSDSLPPTAQRTERTDPETPPPNERSDRNDEKEDIAPSNPSHPSNDRNPSNPKETPFGYGINEEQAVSTKFHHVHSNRNSSVLPLSDSAKISKYKMDVMSCDVIVFHNVHKLTMAMQSVVVQIMKMGSIPTLEHSLHPSHSKNGLLSASNQLCLCTRPYHKSVPYLLRDSCLLDYVLPSKRALHGLHHFVKMEMSEHRSTHSFDVQSAIHQNAIHQNAIQQPSSQMDAQGVHPQHSQHGLFPIPRLKMLYSAVNRVFIHNSIAQYIRDIIIAIRLHPDVRQGCSSFRANEALNISSKFTHFMSRLESRYQKLRTSNDLVDQLIGRVQFVRPKDVDLMAIQILSHRIDIVANEEPFDIRRDREREDRLHSNPLRSVGSDHRMKSNTKRVGNQPIESTLNPNIEQNESSKTVDSPPNPFGSFSFGDPTPLEQEEHTSGDDDDHFKRLQSGLRKATGPDMLRKQQSDGALEMYRERDTEDDDGQNGPNGRGDSRSRYRTGSMSAPRSPRRSKSDLGRGYRRNSVHRGDRRKKQNPDQKAEDDRIVDNESDEIDVEDFEYELFVDSDGDGYFVDEEDEFHADVDDEYGDGDGDYDEMNDEYADEFEEVYMDEMNGDYHANQSAFRNSHRYHYGKKEQGQGWLSDTNERKLSAEQSLVYNLLRRVLHPPK